MSVQNLLSHQTWPAAPKAKDLKGQRFGKLIVKGDPRRYVISGQKRTHWHCVCDCGGESFVVAGSLVRGLTKSCGCEMREVLVTHGYSRDHKATYDVWRAMKERCLNPKCKSYPRYGGAGVVICERWMDFRNFLADMGERPKDLTIDRFKDGWNPADGPLPYSPETCRWATHSQQANNRACNRFFEHAGEKMTSAQWARRFNLCPRFLHRRLTLGWSMLDATTIPKGVRR